MKNVKTSLESLSKDSLIDNLMLDSIKGGCCAGTGSTSRSTTVAVGTAEDESSSGGSNGNIKDGVILDIEMD